MGIIIEISSFSKKYAKDEWMYRKFLNEIRNKPKDICDMTDRAQDVLKFFQIKDLSSGVPIIEILTKFGFKIYQSNLEPEGLSAYIAVDPKFKDVFGSNKITCVHTNDNIGHKRFSLAHELAHYLFDFNEGEELYYYDTYFPQKSEGKVEEKRANRFAAELLMPEKEFREKFEKSKELHSKADIVNALGQYFLVSSTAVLRRLHELDIKGFESGFERQ